MQAIKKVEIIIGYMKLPQLLDVLKKEVLAVSYTVIKEAFGAGGRGEMAGDGLSGEFTNSYLLIACSTNTKTLGWFMPGFRCDVDGTLALRRGSRAGRKGDAVCRLHRYCQAALPH